MDGREDGGIGEDAEEWIVLVSLVTFTGGNSKIPIPIMSVWEGDCVEEKVVMKSEVAGEDDVTLGDDEAGDKGDDEEVTLSDEGDGDDDVTLDEEEVDDGGDEEEVKLDEDGGDDGDDDDDVTLGDEEPDEEEEVTLGDAEEVWEKEGLVPRVDGAPGGVLDGGDDDGTVTLEEGAEEVTLGEEEEVWEEEGLSGGDEEVTPDEEETDDSVMVVDVGAGVEGFFDGGALLVDGCSVIV